MLGLFSLWYFRDNPASLRIEVTSKARVYDIHADVPSLSILFENEDIKKKNQVLSFFTIRISNPGGKPITQDMYDSRLPFGLKLYNGRGFPPEIISYSQKYIAENLAPQIIDGSEIHFERIVLDAQSNFQIRFLVLHGVDLEPYIEPQGKIAGIEFDKNPVIIAPAESKAEPFFTRVISGSILVHFSRFGVYVLAIIAFLIGVFVPVSLVESFNKSRKKKEYTRKFREYQGARQSNYADFLVDLALDSGSRGILLAQKLDGFRFSKRRLDLLLERQIPDMAIRSESPFSFSAPLILRLRECDLIVQVDETLKLKEDFKLQLSDFITFWNVISPTDKEATEEFVNRALQRIADRQFRPVAQITEKEPNK